MSIVQWLREEPGKYFNVHQADFRWVTPSKPKVKARHRRGLARSAKLLELEQLEKRPDLQLTDSSKPSCGGRGMRVVGDS